MEQHSPSAKKSIASQLPHGESVAIEVSSDKVDSSFGSTEYAAGHRVTLI